jgi:RNA recognition motif-containing protein
MIQRLNLPLSAFPPCKSVLLGCSAVLQGLPEDASEGDLQQLLEPLTGVREIRLPQERGSKLCKGYAFVVSEQCS